MLTGMTNAQLTAILAATRTDSVTLDDGSYLDWSTRVGNDHEIEVGDATGDTVTLRLSHADMAELVNRMAATLLAG